MHFYSDTFYYYCKIHQSKLDLPYLLMLHGFMGNGRVFDHLLDELSFFCNPVTIDLAGHGETESPDNPIFYKTERQVQQLHSIIQRLQFSNLFLYGYSMGGRLAFQIITLHSNLFNGVIIESSHCGIDSKTERSERQAVDEIRAQQIERNFEGFIQNWTQLPLFQHTPDALKLVYRKVMKKQEPKKISASLRGFGAGVMPSVCGKISDFDLPLTLIAGELDEKYAKRMTAIHEMLDDSTLQIVTGAGHRVHADRPEKVINILRNSMNQN